MGYKDRVAHYIWAWSLVWFGGSTCCAHKSPNHAASRLPARLSSSRPNQAKPQGGEASPISRQSHRFRSRRKPPKGTFSYFQINIFYIGHFYVQHFSYIRHIRVLMKFFFKSCSCDKWLSYTIHFAQLEQNFHVQEFKFREIYENHCETNFSMLLMWNNSL